MNKTELTKQAGEHLLGAILLNPKIMPRLKKLRGHNFINARQGMIFIELRQMYERGVEIDLVSVKDRFLGGGIDKLFMNGKLEMMEYLMILEENVPIGYNVSVLRSILLENRFDTF